MQTLRPWSTKLPERNWAMGIAVVCFSLLIALPFLPDKKSDVIEKNHANAASTSNQVTVASIQKDSPTKSISKPVALHAKQVIKKNIKPVKTHPKSIQRPQKNTASISAQAYFIQVGAFQDKKHAQNLEKRLIKKHWSAIIQKKTHLYAVQIGPYKNKEKANRIKKQLSDKEKMNGFITHHAYP
ncbi:MAG: SPOR domain-containing protein [Mariprofundaceae bacterium]|nr:SPOR domain-containing protein [Mariprofundaceae bacterium]